jgi:hypothetical protein
VAVVATTLNLLCLTTSETPLPSEAVRGEKVGEPKACAIGCHVLTYGYGYVLHGTQGSDILRAVQKARERESYKHTDTGSAPLASHVARASESVWIRRPRWVRRSYTSATVPRRTHGWTVRLGQGHPGSKGTHRVTVADCDARCVNK